MKLAVTAASPVTRMQGSARRDTGSTRWRQTEAGQRAPLHGGHLRPVRVCQDVTIWRHGKQQMGHTRPQVLYQKHNHFSLVLDVWIPALTVVNTLPRDRTGRVSGRWSSKLEESVLEGG